MLRPYEHIALLGQVGAVLDKESVQTVARPAHQQRAQGLLIKHQTDPILLGYSSDGTPLKTQETFTHSVGSLSVKGKG